MISTIIKVSVKVISRSPRLRVTPYNSNSVSGRKIAIDASMSIYQFLIAVRSDGSQLTNEAGEITRLIHY